MKRFFLVSILVLMLAGLAIAAGWSTFSHPSGQRNADAIINSGPCAITSVIVMTDGANDATLTLYNNTSATGTPVFPPIKVNAADNYGGVVFEDPVYCNTGIYGDIDGTNALYSVQYKKLE